MKNKAITTMILCLAGIFILALNVVPVAATPDGSIVGLWHLDKKFGTALSFDGIDDYVEVDSVSSIMPGILTVEAWIKPDKTGARQSLVSKWDGYGDASYSLELTSTNKFLFYLHDGATTKSITGTTVITVGTWYHVAGTYDGTHARLYVNGVLEAGPTLLVAPMTNSSVPLRIGASSRKPPYPLYCQFRGVIDEVRISNVAYDTFDLTGPLTADGNTVALWHFDDAPDTNASDSSGNENDGMLNNFASPYGWVDTTLAPDTSSNNNFGTIYDATWTTGVFDCALSFDGSDDYVEIPHTTSLDITDQITVRAWINLDIVNEGEPLGGTIIRKGAWPIVVPPPAWGFDIQFGKLRAFIYDEGSAYIANGNTVLSAGVWYHVAFTYDGSEVQIYLNGELEGDPKPHTMGNIDSTTAPVWIGRKNHMAFFGGKIDEVRIDNRVVIEVKIDIKPGSDPNSINLVEHGLLPVAILGTRDFDVTKIDPNTIEIGGVSLALRGSAKKGKKLAYSYDNVDEDIYTDMMIFFDVQELVADDVLEDTTIALELTATLDDGTLVEGKDSVSIVHY